MLRPRRELGRPGLERIVLSDATDALAFGGLSRSVLRRGLTPFARDFAATLADADAAVGRRGLPAASERLLRSYSGPVTYADLARVPQRGPLIAVANHPGTVDTPAVWAALGARDDLLVIALDRPFLHAMPHLAQRTLLVNETPGSRTRLVRRAAAHLRAGGALMTFPAGTIEPDPALRRSDAAASVATWSRSPELFARLVPAALVLPIAVEGVISSRALGSVWARGRPDADARELAASTLQIVGRDTTITPRLRIGEPLDASGRLTDRLAEAMRGLLG